MFKRLQRRIHLPEKPTEIAQKFRRMRPHFGQNFSLHKREQPDEARHAIRYCNRGEKFATVVRYNARQGQLVRALRQMRQRPALQINE
jgi:hypothetical protein